MPVRRVLVAIMLAALLSAAGYTAYWFHVAGELRKGVESWAAERRAVGWQIAWQDMATEGFPGRVRLHFAGPAISRADGMNWQAETLIASAQALTLTHISLAAPGRHQLSWRGGAATLDAAALTGELDLGHGRLREASLAGRGLILTDDRVTIEAEGLTMLVRPLAVADPKHDSETLRFAAAAHDVTLPVLPGLVLDRTVAVAEMSGHVLGPIPQAPPFAALTAWAADGGTIELDRVVLDWAPMMLDADGTLALDPYGQPLAALSARVRGFPALMDRLSAAGLLDPGAATAAKLMLSLMAKPDRQGRPAVPVPVTVQDGGVWMGPARIATMPHLAWPDPAD
jgi:hypothetical protein